MNASAIVLASTAGPVARAVARAVQVRRLLVEVIRLLSVKLLALPFQQAGLSLGSGDLCGQFVAAVGQIASQRGQIGNCRGQRLLGGNGIGSGNPDALVVYSVDCLN